MKKVVTVFILTILLTISMAVPVFCGMGVPADVWNAVGGESGLDALLEQQDATGTFSIPSLGVGTNGTTVTPVNSVLPTPTPVPKPTEKACEHDYVSEITKQPTCAEEGETTYTCTLCGESYTEPIAKSSIHDYQKEVTKEMTCTENGEETYTCSICGDTYTEAVSTIGHQYSSEVTTPATCLEDGEITFTCAACGDVYTEVAPAKGHTEGDWEVSKPAGLFTTGEQVLKCTECGEVFETQVIPTRYPVWYLYVGLAAVVIIIAVIIGTVVMKRKKVENNASV